MVERRNRAREGRRCERCATPRGVLATQERGVVVPIVAVGLIAIMGMLVLVIDVGGLLWARRQMVNGADSAALAAAQSCAKTNDTEDPEQMADEYAVPNASDVDTSGQNIIDEVNCDTGRTGYVTVRYSKDQPLFFGPVLGSGSSTAVPAEATAHWGGVGMSDGIIPLVIYSGSLQGPACNVPEVEEGTVCYFWEDNNLSGQGNFGFLDVENGWNVARGDSCPNTGGDQVLGDWINGTRQIGALELNYPWATWVCTRAGNHSEPQVWNAVRLLRGETRVFPVVGTSPADNQPAQVGTPQPKYNAVGFAQMEIMDVLTVQNTAPLTCGPVNVSTLSSPIDLMALCIGIPDNATFLEIPNGGVTPGNVNGSVTPEGVFSWTGAQPTSIRFTYSVPTTNCGGVPAPNASAHCLVLRWNGYSFESRPVGGGGSFGMMAIALCDQRYNSCVQPGL